MDLALLNEIKIGATPKSKFWIKHSDLEDEAYLEELTTKFTDLATRRKIPLEKEAIVRAHKDGTWTDTNQRDLESLEAYLIRIQESYDKVVETQKKYLKPEVDDAIIKVQTLKQRKALAIGKTAEDWAFKLAHERYILSLFYKDKALTKRVWDEDDIEMLEQRQVDTSIKDFFFFRQKFSDEALKELACSGFCQNLYYAAGNSFNLFGKAILNLSCLQQRFGLLLENYKAIIGQISGKVSDSFLSDWKELDKWAKSSEMAREQIEKSWSGNRGDSKINYENIKKASMVQGEENEVKAIQDMLG